MKQLTLHETTTISGAISRETELLAGTLISMGIGSYAGDALGTLVYGLYSIALPTFTPPLLPCLLAYKAAGALVAGKFYVDHHWDEIKTMMPSQFQTT